MVGSYISQIWNHSHCYASGAFISAKLIFKLKDVNVLHCVQPIKQGYNESYDFIKFNGKIMVSCDIVY